MTSALARLADGSFLSRARIRLWSGAFLAGFAVAIVFLFATARGLNDYDGRPLGTDFSNVYAAGISALKGDPAAPFDVGKQEKLEQAIFGPATPFYGWHYPPFFLLIAAPLALLPYVAALVLWQLGTLALYLLALRALLKRRAPDLLGDSTWLLAGLGFTAVFVNLTHGHNGFLTAALFAGALALLDERPLLAGLLFGLLAYKPQFAMMLPLVLAASGRWRVFLAAAVTVLALAALTTLLFGVEVWPAFLAASRFTRRVILEQGATGFHKIQSVFAWIRLWGGSVALAYAGQALASLLVAVALIRLWRSPAPFGIKGAALCLGALLATPYSLDYDLMVLAPAIALLAVEARARPLPYQAALPALLWLVPIATREVAQHALIPLGLWSMMLAFWSLWRHRPRAADGALRP
jgi:hypothetical protein